MCQRLEGISDIIIEEGNMSPSFWEADQLGDESHDIDGIIILSHFHF